MTRHVVVHIGLEKTGTTSLQRYCHDHRRALLARGLLYPHSNAGWARNHSPLVAAYIAHRPQGPTVALRWRPRAAAVAALAAELDASPAATALVSSEHFATHFDRSEAEQLAEDLGRFAPTIAVVVRDTHARFLSAYNTHVTAGGSLPIEAYAHAMLVPGTRFMSASRTLAIWEAAVGRERMHVIDYDAEPDMTAAVLRACGVTMPPRAPYRDRASLAPTAIELLRRANAALAARQPVTGRAGLAAWAQHSLFSIRVRRRLARQTAAGPRVWRLAAETLARLDAIAAEDRRWIADAYGLALRGADARSRIVVGADAETADDAALQRRAEALVDRATRGLWGPSRALAALYDRVRPPA